jgi:hypothetical protein
MKNAAAIFGRPARRKITGEQIKWVLPDQLIGVEIEVEFAGSTLPENGALAPYWSGKHDGSLRNGKEFVLSTPLKGEQLSNAVAAIFHDSVFTRSTTGSTHIHLDMMEEDTMGDTIKVITLLLYCLESAVFAAADRGREFCGYTNKLCTAPDIVLASVLGSSEEEDYETLRRMCRDEEGVGRYYGLNLMSMQKFGSMEFRYFPTCTSATELISWIQLVMSFKKAALEIGTTDRLYEIFNNEDLYDQFLVKYFEPWIDIFRMEVPQYTSIVMLKKAIAVAGSKLLQGENKKQQFDIRAVVKSKSLAKFAAKLPRRPADITPLDIINVVSPIPRDVTEGQIMLYSGSFYIFQERDWRTAYDLHIRSLESGRTALASVNAINNVNHLMDRLNVLDAASRRRTIIQWEILCNELRAAYSTDNLRMDSNRDVEYLGLEVLDEELVDTPAQQEVMPVDVPVVEQEAVYAEATAEGMLRELVTGERAPWANAVVRHMSPYQYRFEESLDANSYTDQIINTTIRARRT